jgi:hypothetical protein
MVSTNIADVWLHKEEPQETSRSHGREDSLSLARSVSESRETNLAALAALALGLGLSLLFALGGLFLSLVFGAHVVY